MVDDRPAWARRILKERKLRGWSQADAVQAMRAHSEKVLPDDATMLRQWRRWESGETMPSEDFYAPIIAATLGTVTHALFPVSGKRDGNTELLAVSGMETLEIVSRIQASDVDNSTLEALRITADRLCSEYPYMPGDQLAYEGRAWLRRITEMQDQRLTLAQHRETLALAGLIALLVGCVEYDMGDRQAAEATRRIALSLGKETDNHDVFGWAHEMRAWFSLTTGDYRGVISAANTGSEIGQERGVTVQLLAQQAKAWARIGDRRQTEVALDQGRKLLERLPYPENLDHHFVVDPAKFDFYAMDCYRMLGDDRTAENLAEEVIRAGTDFDGTERSPMRITEARITLGVVAARRGDLEQAVSYGRRAIEAQRRSIPSLLMVSRELTSILQNKYSDEQEAREYLEQLHEVTHTPLKSL